MEKLNESGACNVWDCLSKGNNNNVREGEILTKRKKRKRNWLQWSHMRALRVEGREGVKKKERMHCSFCLSFCAMHGHKACSKTHSITTNHYAFFKYTQSKNMLCALFCFCFCLSLHFQFNIIHCLASSCIKVCGQILTYSSYPVFIFTTFHHDHLINFLLWIILLHDWFFLLLNFYYGCQ